MDQFIIYSNDECAFVNDRINSAITLKVYTHIIRKAAKFSSYKEAKQAHLTWVRLKKEDVTILKISVD